MVRARRNPSQPSVEAELAGEGPVEPHTASEAFKIELPAFEGPLDLLLHLIREHKLDILDIPMSLIAERYLGYLDAMQALNIDVAAEFLVMAATLTHIKSRMLLPRQDSPDQDVPEEEGEDPRAALVLRLLEYQKYREAGEALGQRSILGRDVFARPPVADSGDPDDRAEVGYAEVSVFKLIEAFDRTLRAARLSLAHEVVLDRLSVSDAINAIVERFQRSTHLSFEELLASAAGEGLLDRHRVVVTFLAVLEMAKLKLVRIVQRADTGELAVTLRSGDQAPHNRQAGDETSDDDGD